jgi:putative FmdB family regulatory protein
MPLFEYQCKTCHAGFERILRATESATAACPQCGSANVRKAVSSFAAFSAGADGMRMVGGGCCGGREGACACAGG